jgi:ankyrin repeat protein
MLSTFIEEVRAGKREGSIASTQTTGSLSADEKEAWRQLRKELESVGITPALFTQQQELIVTTLCKVIIDDQDLAGDIAVAESGAEALPTLPATVEPGANLTDDSLQSSRPQVTYNNVTDVVKNPGRVAKLLYRITNRRRALIEAAKNGDTTLAKQLLEKGAFADSKDSNDITPLSWAAYYGHEAVARLLLETGRVDADSKDKYGRTPLSLATSKRHKAVVRLLQQPRNTHS